jgi:hypothetical protein
MDGCSPRKENEGSITKSRMLSVDIALCLGFLIATDVNDFFPFIPVLLKLQIFDRIDHRQSAKALLLAKLNATSYKLIGILEWPSNGTHLGREKSICYTA